MENKVLRTEWLTRNLTTTISCNEQPIQVLQDFIDELKELGATHFEMGYSTYDEETREVDFNGYKIFYESDEELKIRKEKEDVEESLARKAMKEQIEANERLQYLKLKEKYDGK